MLKAAVERRLIYLNLKTYLFDDLLVKMDRMSMAHALEVQVYAQESFEDLLPKEILTRGKRGLDSHLERDFRVN